MRGNKVYIETYGCQMNISDTELMHGILAEEGFEVAARAEEADVVLVNTCAIREHAEQRVLGRVGQLQQLREEKPDLVLGITGCMAQRLGADLLNKAGGVELVMGPDQYRSLPEVLSKLRRGSDPVAASTGRTLPVLQRSNFGEKRSNKNSAGQRLAVLDFDWRENYEGIEPRRTSAVSAWVPVQRGCNYRCTYCIVPYVRGPEKNREPDDVLREVRSLVEAGIPEITLLGQSVNSYSLGDWDFPRLLRAVARIDGVERVRFTSPHPNNFTPELVQVMAEEPTVCKQLHLPVQSGHDRTLKRMLRRYSVATYEEKIAWVKEAIPEITLSTDVIVAFPGESEEEYEATLHLMERIRYDDFFLYKYSAREGTPATRLPREQEVPEEVAQERLAKLITLCRGIQLEKAEAKLGRVEEVLVEKEARRGGWQGRTDGNQIVAFEASSDLGVGSFASVRLLATTGSTFQGELVR